MAFFSHLGSHACMEEMAVRNCILLQQLARFKLCKSYALRRQIVFEYLKNHRGFVKIGYCLEIRLVKHFSHW